MSARPRLRTDLVLVEQTYRGEQSYIVKDRESRKYFRFRPVEVAVMQAFDGERTIPEAAEVLAAEGLRVSPAALEAFARKLTGMGLCERTVAERSVLLMERLRAQRRRRLGQGSGPSDIFRMRWSVGDPDHLLQRCLPHLRFCFTRGFVALSVALFAAYFVILGLKWPEFVGTIADLYTLNAAVGTFVVFWLTGLLVIVIHELGHAFTCKHFGGEVHEIGAMLIYFQPAFYCNVNDAWTFPDLRARLWVTAAGSWIQMVVAAIAAIVWWAAVPDTLVSHIALAAVVVGGFTTVLSNMNPLIPLDGYYALSDYLEVPNLRHRAFAHLAWAAKRRLLGLDLPEPPADERERRIFFIYGGLAVAYITCLLLATAAIAYSRVGELLGATGGVIAAVAVGVLLRSRIRSAAAAVRLFVRERWAAWRPRRLWGRVAVVAGALILLGALIPRPVTVGGRFVVAPAGTTLLTAAAGGVVAGVGVREGVRVEPGTPLLVIRNLDLERRAAVERRLADSLAVRESRARARGNAGEAAQLEAERLAAEARHAGVEATLAALTLRAPVRSVVLTSRPEELAGRRVETGDVVLTLGRSEAVEVRIALAGAGATLVRPGQPVRLLRDATLDRPVAAAVAAVAPAALPGHPDALEARVALPAAGWQPGMTGEARVAIRASNLWGALWWRLRGGVRSDLLL